MRPANAPFAWISLAAAGLALAGCAVGPNYKAPQVPAQAGGAFVSTGPNVADEALPDDWWRLYDDPVLDRLVREALVENQDLKVAAANLANAEGLVSEARAGLFPSTQVTSAATYGRGSTTSTTSTAQTGEKGPPSWFYATGFTAAYQVDLFGQVRRSIEAARGNAEAQQAAEDAVRVTVAAETAAAYANVCGFAEQVAVAKHSLQVVQQTYDITVLQRDAGALSDFDVARQATLLEQARAVVPTLEGQRRAALFELTALLGKTPAEAPADAAACQTPPRVTRPLPVGDGAALLKRRPDIRQADRQLASATARIGVAVSSLFPSVTLGGAVTAGGNTPGHTFNFNATSYSVGPLVTWTFPNTLVALAQIRQARATASGALASFDSTVIQALKETEQALTTYAAELERHTALGHARDQADRAYKLAQTQYQAGMASYLDLLVAETTLINADQALAASDQQISSDQVAVFQALGGGWENAPPVVAPKVG